MNHNQDVAYNSIKIISNTESYDKKSGSIVINGGIGCKKTIHCETICAQDSFFNNVTINGSINNIKFDIFTAENSTINHLTCDHIRVNSHIHSDELEINQLHFHTIIPDIEDNNIGTDDNRVNLFSNNANITNLTIENINIDSFKFNKLIPKNYNSQIGDEEYRISLFANKINSNFGKFNEDLYSKILKAEKLDIYSDICLTNDYKNKKMITTNANDSKIDINGDIINLNNNSNSLNITDDGIGINGLIVLGHVILDMNNYSKKYIYPKESLIFLTGAGCHEITLSKQINEHDVNSVVRSGTYIKIVNLCKVNIIINEFILNNNGNYYEFIFIQNQWICLNKGRSKTNNIIEIIQDKCICDTEDETINESSNYCNDLDSDDNFSIN